MDGATSLGLRRAFRKKLSVHGNRRVLEQRGMGLLKEPYREQPTRGAATITSELENRIKKLEDVEAIKQFKALYCDICDDAHNPDRITQLFVDDGIWEAGEFGKAQGPDAIGKVFQGFQEQISFSQHNISNPRIEVDGDRASGIWYIFGPFTFRDDDDARWIAARHDDEYVKVNGVWFYQHLRATIRMFASYEKGWAGNLKGPSQNPDLRP